jgi:elongation factor Ts
MTYICPERGAAGMIEVNCETDFVSSNEKFQAFARNLAEAAAKNPAADLDAFMAVPYGDEGTVADALKETIHLFGENMQIPRFTRIVPEGTGAVVDYVHMGGKLGVLAQFAFENADTAGKDEFKVAARDVCMQIAAANPISVDSDSVDPAVIEHEMEIYKAQAAASGKPEAIQVKIAEGRLHKFFKEQCLVEQEFVKNPDITVADHLAQASKAVGDEISVVRFIRWGLGESAE